MYIDCVVVDVLLCVCVFSGGDKSTIDPQYRVFKWWPISSHQRASVFPISNAITVSGTETWSTRSRELCQSTDIRKIFPLAQRFSSVRNTMYSVRVETVAFF